VKIKLLRFLLAGALVAAPMGLAACGGYQCDDVAGSTVLADDDDCGDDD
jgi:hypothetical protein